MTWWNFYFQLHNGTIKTEQVIGFLRALMRHIPTDLTIVWDRLAAHRSCALRDFVAEQGGRIVLELLPAYAPELNPVEYLWGYWKQHAMTNFCADDFNHLSYEARERLRRLRRRKTLIAAFWQQTGLF